MEQTLFDPYHLRPLASLNRRQTISLRGIDPDIAGETGWNLLSTPALIMLIQSHVSALGLTDVDSKDLPVHLNALLKSSNEPARTLAESISGQYGERLGYVVASLLLTSEGLTSPMDEWEQAYLRHWQEEVKEIVLGGGLSSGVFGKHIGKVAKRVLMQCGISHCRINVAEYPTYLPLIGAARNHLEGMPDPVAVLDFGGSWAKRGLAFYDTDQALYRLQVLPSRHISALTVPGKTAELADAMIAIISETILKADLDKPVAPTVLCSIAAYVENGQPVKIERGTYTSFHHFSPDVMGWFSQQLSKVAGRSMQVVFFRDGDVAACTYAGRPHTAIILIGTALGAGFVSPQGDYRPVSDHFSLVENPVAF